MGDECGCLLAGLGYLAGRNNGNEKRRKGRGPKVQKSTTTTRRGGTEGRGGNAQKALKLKKNFVCYVAKITKYHVPTIVCRY